MKHINFFLIAGGDLSNVARAPAYVTMSRKNLGVKPQAFGVSLALTYQGVPFFIKGISLIKLPISAALKFFRAAIF